MVRLMVCAPRATGLVLKDSAFYGKLVLKHSTCEAPAGALSLMVRLMVRAPRATGQRDLLAELDDTRMVFALRFLHS
jgi:hypothetical protein